MKETRILPGNLSMAFLASHVKTQIADYNNQTSSFTPPISDNNSQKKKKSFLVLIFTDLHRNSNEEKKNPQTEMQNYSRNPNLTRYKHTETQKSKNRNRNPNPLSFYKLNETFNKNSQKSRRNPTGESTNLRESKSRETELNGKMGKKKKRRGKGGKMETLKEGREAYIGGRNGARIMGGGIFIHTFKSLIAFTDFKLNRWED